MAGKRWGLEGTPVWVLLYDHEHGVDTWVLSSEKKAIENAGEIVFQDVEDGDIHDEEISAEIKAQFKAKKYKEAVDAWRFYQDERASRPSTIVWLRARIDSKTSAS